MSRRLTSAEYWRYLTARGKNIEFVFNIIPKRELKKRFAGTAANGNPSTAANDTTKEAR